MRKLVMAAVAAATSASSAAQSPYPHRSFAEKFDCRPTALPQFTGQAPSAGLARQLLTSTGAKKLRWLQPGEAAGKAKKSRVTAQLDPQGRIATAFCG
ncbi:MAG TPA: hypothetical protein VFK50_08470 [Sphingomicrobium sp.]|nr:hypothetical protein [Sphingomicrobium sp.]